MNVMFWNTNGTADADVIAGLASEHGVDVLVLAELDHDRERDLLRRSRDFRVVNKVRTRVRPIRIFSRYAADAVVLLSRMKGWDGCRLRIPGANAPITLIGVHLRSKLHSDESDRTYGARELSRYIAERETELGDSNTLVIGDFNADPFEASMVEANALHGVMTRDIARKRSRTVAEVRRPFFYNPMWSRLGDGSCGPPGTYYHADSGQNAQFWHTFDQVLLRPALLPYFSHAALRVVERFRGRDLLRPSGRKAGQSDHLPTVVGLAIEGEAA